MQPTSRSLQDASTCFDSPMFADDFTRRFETEPSLDSTRGTQEDRGEAETISMNVDTSAVMPVVVNPPEPIQYPITGYDTSLPVFDGYSSDPKDWLIDLESDSMERLPDVRIYFWHIGSCLEVEREEKIDKARHLREVELDYDHEISKGANDEKEDWAKFDPPSDLPQRVLYDDRLVKAGREYLRESRARGHGYYLSAHRVNLANNKPGNEWYRLITIGIAFQLLGRIAPVESEGNFYDDNNKDWEIGASMIRTNIRMPLMWADSRKEGVVSGTLSWERLVALSYSVNLAGSPLYCILLTHDREATIAEHMRFKSNYYDNVDLDKASRVLDRDWPGLFEEESDDEYTGQSLLSMCNSNVDQFLGRNR